LETLDAAAGLRPARQFSYHAPSDRLGFARRPKPPALCRAARCFAQQRIRFLKATCSIRVFAARSFRASPLAVGARQDLKPRNLASQLFCQHALFPEFLQLLRAPFAPPPIAAALSRGSPFSGPTAGTSTPPELGEFRDVSPNSNAVVFHRRSHCSIAIQKCTGVQIQVRIHSPPDRRKFSPVPCAIASLIARSTAIT